MTRVLFSLFGPHFPTQILAGLLRGRLGVMAHSPQFHPSSFSSSLLCLPTPSLAQPAKWAHSIKFDITDLICPTDAHSSWLGPRTRFMCRAPPAGLPHSVVVNDSEFLRNKLARNCAVHLNVGCWRRFTGMPLPKRTPNAPGKGREELMSRRGY